MRATRFPTVLLLATFPLAAQVTTVESRFEGGSVEGWTHVGASVFTTFATGGNPNGYLHIDNSEGPVTYIYAPASYRGNLGSYLGGTFSFDGKMIGTGGATWNDALDYGHVWLVSGGIEISCDVEPNLPSTSAYTTYTMPLLPASWNTTPATFATVLANVTELRISVEALFGAEVQAIDNVILAPAAAPASAVTFAPGCGTSSLAATSLPWTGTTFGAQGTGMPQPAFVFSVFGIAPVAPPLPLVSVFPQAGAGCSLHVSPDVVGAVYSTNGQASSQLGIPNNPTLVGATFRLQMIPAQVDAALSFVAIGATNALLMTVGAY